LVVEIAVVLRELLGRQGLESWPKLTGGKGLHIMVPLGDRKLTHHESHQFSRTIAERIAAKQPDRLTTSAASRARDKRLFIDYLRNSCGTTAIATYSPRARRGFPIAAPTTWAALETPVSLLAGRPNAASAAWMLWPIKVPSYLRQPIYEPLQSAEQASGASVSYRPVNYRCTKYKKKDPHAHEFSNVHRGPGFALSPRVKYQVRAHEKKHEPNQNQPCGRPFLSTEQSCGSPLIGWPRRICTQFEPQANATGFHPTVTLQVEPKFSRRLNKCASLRSGQGSSTEVRTGEYKGTDFSALEALCARKPEDFIVTNPAFTQ
jgi:hypothetical protein